VTPEQEDEIDRAVKAIQDDAYRRGWRDAMIELRRRALEVRYEAPLTLPRSLAQVGPFAD
jgi:hypothetical protein